MKKDNGIMFVQMTMNDFLEDKPEKELKDNIKKYGNNVCPECGHPLLKRNGCKICDYCGYEACEI